MKEDILRNVSVFLGTLSHTGLKRHEVEFLFWGKLFLLNKSLNIETGSSQVILILRMSRYFTEATKY